MANVKISSLTTLSSLGDTDVFPVVNSSTTKQITALNIKNYMATYGNTQVAAYLLAPGPIGSTTAGTGAFTTLSATTTGTSGAITATYNPASAAGAAILTTGKDSQGGVGYFDFLKATSTTSGVTNANKYFRLNSTGALEVVNSAYSAVIFQLKDDGTTTVGNLITSNGVFWGNGTAYSTGGGSSYGNTQVAQYLPTYTGNVQTANLVISSSPLGQITSTPGSNANVTINPDGTGWLITTAITPAWFGNTVTIQGATTAGIFRGTQVQETCQFITPANAAVQNFDCSSGQVFEANIAAQGINFTANLQNLNLPSGYCTTVTVVLKQPSAAGYYPANLTINGTSQTYNTNWFWQGGSTPSGSPGKRDVVAFNITNNGGTYTTYAQLVTWG